MRIKLLGIIAISISCSLTQANAQDLEEIAKERITTLNELIKNAEDAGIDVLKEKMTVRTAEVFLFYANWDENNIADNITVFEKVARYKNTAQETAEMLPDFERQEVIDMLDEAIKYTNSLISGEVTRKITPNLDWAKITHNGDQLSFNNRPVFTADYTWKPTTAGTFDLLEYHGNEDGIYMDMNKVTNANGDINGGLLNEIQNKKGNSTLGFVFIGNKGIPDWAEDKWGPGFKLPTDRYTIYDIDNPGAREINGMLLRATVPDIAGQKYNELGYMLCNEPHFYTTKKENGDLDWASGPVSDYTIEKFKTWLSEKHASITDLNTLWKTNFSSFNDVTIDIPISVGLIGTPKWYDWITFNHIRVTQWYSDIKDTIKRYDANAKVHLKIMPNLWTDNKRGHGIDMEALTELSEIIGNDSGSENAPMWGEPYEWQEHYAFDWRELYMGFDFYKSVSPDKLMYNTETHYLSTGRSRDLHQEPIYARATFWAAATHGLNANQIWYWMRDPDGGYNTNRLSGGYGASNNHQPRIVNEVHSVNYDLNAYAEEITSMQRQRKPLRIFYSETSATNKAEHMDDLFELYEDIVFEGVPIGFTTKNIINKQDNNLWDAVLVWKTEFVTKNELDALQTYLDNGGTVISDVFSLKKDEYGNSLPELSASSGNLIMINGLQEINNKAFDQIETAGLMPEISITETSGMGKKGCAWKYAKNSDGNNIISVINLGKADAKLTIRLKNAQIGTACKDLLNGIEVSTQPTLKPNEVYFVEVTDDDGIDNPGTTFQKENAIENRIEASLHPTPSTGDYTIKFSTRQQEVEVIAYNIAGQSIQKKKYYGVSKVSDNLNRYADGLYIIQINTANASKNFSFIKNN